MSYLLLGYGKSNQAVARYFFVQGIPYSVYDDFIPEARRDVDFNAVEKIVKTGGVKNDHLLLDAARKLKKEIVSDLELFYTLNKQKTFITVTGTNGKTTTVHLLKYMLPDLDLAGNVGFPLFDFIDSKKDMIIEASSFMLEYTDTFHSKINVILNIKPNHLDHHGSFQAYLDAKMKLLKNVKADDYLIYNGDDEILSEAVKDFRLNKIPFSRKKPDGIFIAESDIYYFGKKVFSGKNIKLLGNHNLENIAAAIGAVLCYDPSFTDFNCINDFNHLPHRLEYLGKIKDVSVYNDSKATNFTALKISLSAFPFKKIVLIAGGKMREEDPAALDGVLKSLDLVLANGENREVLREYFEKRGIKCLTYPDLESLLADIELYLGGKEILLFSPGAVSYDQFKNFEERGNFFKEKIKPLLNE